MGERVKEEIPAPVYYRSAMTRRCCPWDITEQSAVYSDRYLADLASLELSALRWRESKLCASR